MSLANKGQQQLEQQHQRTEQYNRSRGTKSKRVLLPSPTMWCVLGTLGSFFVASRLILLRFLLSPPAPPALPAAVSAARPWAATLLVAGMSLDSLSDREGFEEEHRLWWPRPRNGVEADAALGADETRVDVRPLAACGVVETTLRTDEGSMVLDSSLPRELLPYVLTRQSSWDIRVVVGESEGVEAGWRDLQ